MEHECGHWWGRGGARLVQGACSRSPGPAPCVEVSSSTVCPHLPISPRLREPAGVGLCGAHCPGPQDFGGWGSGGTREPCGHPPALGPCVCVQHRLTPPPQPWPGPRRQPGVALAAQLALRPRPERTQDACPVPGAEWPLGARVSLFPPHTLLHAACSPDGSPPPPTLPATALAPGPGAVGAGRGLSQAPPPPITEPLPPLGPQLSLGHPVAGRGPDRNIPRPVTEELLSVLTTPPVPERPASSAGCSVPQEGRSWGKPLTLVVWVFSQQFISLFF